MNTARAQCISAIHSSSSAPAAPLVTCGHSACGGSVSRRAGGAVGSSHRISGRHWARVIIGLSISAVILGCAGSGKGRSSDATDAQNAQAAYRAAHREYGRSMAGVWSPLTSCEIRALRMQPAAAQGNAEALFRLAIFASGDVRDSAAVEEWLGRIRAFVVSIRPRVLAAATDEQRGRIIFSTMCETFFNSWRDGELRSYKFAQSQLSQLMRTGEFNCVSSALLYLVCARWFSLDVQGVELPGHVFVQLRTAEGRVIDVETTNKLGFGLLHVAAQTRSIDYQQCIVVNKEPAPR